MIALPNVKHFPNSAMSLMHHHDLNLEKSDEDYHTLRGCEPQPPSPKKGESVRFLMRSNLAKLLH